MKLNIRTHAVIKKSTDANKYNNFPMPSTFIKIAKTRKTVALNKSITKFIIIPFLPTITSPFLL